MCIVQLNEGSVVDETKCRMRIDETLSETDHQEGNNENKVRFTNVSLNISLSTAS